MPLMTPHEISEINLSDYRASVREEQRIVRKLVRAILKRGYTISVNDGEETTLHRSTDARAIFSALRTTEEDYLQIYGATGSKRFGCIWLLWGNGEDVIADNTSNEVTSAIVDGLNL